jgi:hypothetical protein
MVQLQCNKHFKSMVVKSAAQPGYAHRLWCPCCNAKQLQHWGHASQSKYEQTFTLNVLDKLAGVTYVLNSKTCMSGGHAFVPLIRSAHIPNSMSIEAACKCMHTEFCSELQLNMLSDDKPAITSITVKRDVCGAGPSTHDLLVPMQHTVFL